MRAHAVLIALVTGLGLLLVVAVLRPAGVRTEPAPAAAASAFHAPVAAPAEAPEKPSEPVRVRVGAVGVDSPVVPVGVDERGRMAVPYDVRTIGWYRFGSHPGAAAGSGVLAGHVDDREQGAGAFVHLGELAASDAVVVDLADGTTLHYRVRTVEEISKAELPEERLFDRSGPPRLTLVTCSGTFDAVAREYRNNVVVTAEPVLG